MRPDRFRVNGAAAGMGTATARTPHGVDTLAHPDATDPETPYPDLCNPDLLDRIPLDARTVLDVGCGTGSLLAAYRRLNPRARLLGIEHNQAAARTAATRLDAVAMVDVETDPTPFSSTGLIDCIVYGDVLEHLRDPWPVVERQMAMLSDDGTILICVPNLEHWSFAARLLRGNWDYEPTGLFDRTHLRWYSLESMRRALVAVGLAPHDVHPRVFDAERAEAFAAAIEPGLTALGIDAAAFAKRATPLQYVWRARKRAGPPFAIVGNMLKPVGGVSHVRVVHPLRALSTDSSVSTLLVASGEVPVVAADLPKVFLLHRPILTGRPGFDLLASLNERGWLVVTEFDDHPDFFKGMDSPEQYAFRGVHAVQTTTPALADILRPRNPETAIFPNAVRELPEPRNFTDPGSLTLFFGALNRDQDWLPFMPALNSVTRAAGDRLRFCVVHDQGFFDALETPRKSFVPTCDYETYLDLLGASEISFMPLGDTVFNRAKSDLKFIEAGAARVAALASPTVYAGSIEDGRTGILFHDTDELRERLMRLVAMPDLTRGIAEAARTHVAEKRMLAYQVAERMAWYRSLWSRRSELSRALVARVPELARAARPHG